MTIQSRFYSRTTRFVILIIFCFGGGNVSLAEPIEINGEWIAMSIVSTGMISDRYWNRVSPLVGTTVNIESQEVQLLHGVKCTLRPLNVEYWQNDMKTFGSFGGDWAQLGLKVTGTQGFEVLLWDLVCPEPDWPSFSIITQAGNNVLLLGSFRVFVTLERTEE